MTTNFKANRLAHTPFEYKPKVKHYELGNYRIQILFGGKTDGHLAVYTDTFDGLDLDCSNYCIENFEYSPDYTFLDAIKLFRSKLRISSMPYEKFLFYQLYVLKYPDFGKLEYDTQFFDIEFLYLEFLESENNVKEMGLYQSIENYLKL